MKISAVDLILKLFLIVMYDLQTEDSHLDESKTAPQECIYRPLAELERASTNLEGITSLQVCA